MTQFEFVEFIVRFWLPLVCATAALIGAVLGVGFREVSDAPWTDWPREEDR